MTFTFTAVVKATAAKFNFAACSRHAKCSFRVRLHTKIIYVLTSGRKVTLFRTLTVAPSVSLFSKLTTKPTKPSEPTENK
jgi:hypothetical protein